MCTKERDILLAVISKYKKMPYLWKKDHESYLNKDLRIQGFNKLLEIYKSFNEKANLKIVKKKLENMRTNYLKELKKVLASKQSGVEEEVYVPTLWYFDALSFLGNYFESVRNVTDALNNETQNPSSDDETTVNKQHEQISKKRRAETPIKIHNPMEKQVPVSETIENKPAKVVPQNDEKFEIYGRSIGYQMTALDEHQLVICQKLISDAIFLARLNKLNENSHIVTPSAEAAFHQHPLCTSSLVQPKYLSPYVIHAQSTSNIITPQPLYTNVPDHPVQLQLSQNAVGNSSESNSVLPNVTAGPLVISTDSTDYDVIIEPKPEPTDDVTIITN